MYITHLHVCGTAVSSMQSEGEHFAFIFSHLYYISIGLVITTWLLKSAGKIFSLWEDVFAITIFLAIA